ncbi:dihydrofolate reductase family protein [Motilibacter aurantiacus]|uniref:dihydrofolate reductase family protein n=1 Tax=Motilibacter aurantiacus TaxID=2714955 RepID=UPI001409C1EC|nr:dihydrofolate reductase family protein [Motilibacter aurantiacus]NHC44536.1 dihydrofolate reductase [Motilibacter aurantiacus]
MTATRRFTGAVFIATSLDGYIARRDGDIDWLTGRSESIGETGYEDFMAQVDCLVMGRGTYEKALTFDHWPYAGRPVLVLSGRAPADADERVRVVRTVEEAVAVIEEAGARRVYVDGGQVIRSFLAHGLIDELTVTTAPVLLGDGLPLFGRLDADIALEHLRTAVLGGGFVQSTYAVLH